MSTPLDTLKCPRCIENRGWEPGAHRVECFACKGSGVSLSAPPVEAIIAYEQGELDSISVVVLYARLRRSGMLDGLQGSYGRGFAALVDAGLLDTNGVPTEYAYQWAEEVSTLVEEGDDA